MHCSCCTRDYRAAAALLAGAAASFLLFLLPESALATFSRSFILLQSEMPEFNSDQDGLKWPNLVLDGLRKSKMVSDGLGKSKTIKDCLRRSKMI